MTFWLSQESKTPTAFKADAAHEEETEKLSICCSLLMMQQTFSLYLSDYNSKCLLCILHFIPELNLWNTNEEKKKKKH